MSTGKTKLILGLGNPGKDYDNTRHNIGFRIVETLANHFNISLNKEKKFEALIGSDEIKVDYKISRKVKEKLETEIVKENEDGEKYIEIEISYQKKNIEEEKTYSGKLILALPQTYMNDSGRAVSKIANFYKIPHADILVVQDDVTLETGKLKPAFDRGAGGQHGIEDIIDHFGGDKKFHRLKFGVGPDPGGDRRADYVLTKFPKAERDLIDQACNSAEKMLIAWLLDEDHQQLVSF